MKQGATSFFQCPHSMSVGILFRPNNFGDFVDSIYPIELEIKGTTDIQIDLFHSLTYTSKLTVRGGLEETCCPLRLAERA
jgi:hypothetical protein